MVLTIIPSLAPTAPFFFPELDELVEARRGPLAGTVWFNAVRLTGAGALAAVKLVLRPDAMNTDPPPAPTAEVFGAVKGT